MRPRRLGRWVSVRIDEDLLDTIDVEAAILVISRNLVVDQALRLWVDKRIAQQVSR